MTVLKENFINPLPSLVLSLAEVREGLGMGVFLDCNLDADNYWEERPHPTNHVTLSKKQGKSLTVCISQ
jgi:hypothetical protein